MVGVDERQSIPRDLIKRVAQDPSVNNFGQPLSLRSVPPDLGPLCFCMGDVVT
jgi:hypothetical protein